MQLRPYQERAIQDLRNAFRLGAQAPLLVLPTGGGKTIIFTEITRAAAEKGKKVLVLVHRKELINQTSQKLDWVGVEHGIIAAGYPEKDCPVQVASVSTIVRRLEKIEWRPCLIIIDEAHHAVAGSWRKVTDHWSESYRLGVTATPCRLDGRGLSTAFDTLVPGPSVHDLVFANYLSPSKIFAPPMAADLSGVRKRAGDYAEEQLARAMDRPVITGNAVSQYRKHALGQQAIAFCCNVKHAESVCKAFNTAGIKAGLLLGQTLERDDIVKSFGDATIQVLVTVEVVSEGFDVPAASCAILLRPTKSLSLYLQQVGRVLRPAPGKEAAIILDHSNNVRTHGFPDDEREWSLLEGAKKNSSNAPAVRECPICYAAFKPAPICPQCGHEFEKEKKAKTLGHKEGELEELKRENVRQKIEEKLDKNKEKEKRKQEQVNAKTLTQLLELAALRGYSPGWAYKVMQGRKRSGV